MSCTSCSRANRANRSALYRSQLTIALYSTCTSDRRTPSCIIKGYLLKTVTNSRNVCNNLQNNDERVSFLLRSGRQRYRVAHYNVVKSIVVCVDQSHSGIVKHCWRRTARPADALLSPTGALWRAGLSPCRPPTAATAGDLAGFM